MRLFGSTYHHFTKLALVAIALMFTVPSASIKADEQDRPPVITYFGWMNPMDNYFLFYGTVEDEIPYACLVTFFGANGYLDGAYASTDANGNFYFVVELPPELLGSVDAIAVDDRNNLSEMASTWVVY